MPQHVPRLKVVDVTEFWSERGGGVRSFLTAKARALVERGVEHLVIAPGPRAETSELAAAVGAKARLLRIPGPSMPYDPTYYLLFRFQHLRSAIRRERPDILEIHSPELAALWSLLLPKESYGVRTFVWHADFIDAYLREPMDRWLPRPISGAIQESLWAWVRLIARSCAKTLVASPTQAQKLRSHGVESVVELPFGVDKTVFNPGARDAAIRAELLAGREDALLLVGAGRFAGEKRWDVVLEAFFRFRERRKAKLILFGDGPERPRLERMLEGRDDVELRGFERDRKKLASALASADALIHGGPSETFCLAIAEALACGIPIVVPDTGAASDLLPSGCSLSYTARDPQSFAAALDRLFSQSPETLQQGSRESVERVWSSDTYFDRLVALYTDLSRTEGRQPFAGPRNGS
jgi:alpha-1,6-mannosyltransferase